ncbi:hypothetical protein BH10PLA2_BH10PLA2_07740 [soil metagenome]
MTLTAFSWGYFGWGNATGKFVELVDAVETRRGFAPPVFVDIRIRRNVRAAGFAGPAFENLLGPERHVWLPKLGNRFIVSRQGPPIQIVDPQAAFELLGLIQKFARENRRVLFFCGCVWPKQEGATCCHRDTVAELLLNASRDNGQSLAVVEWPGGIPQAIGWAIDEDAARGLKSKRTRIPAGSKFNLAESGSVAWGSILQPYAYDQPVALIGPAQFTPSGWTHPVLQHLPAGINTKAAFEQADDLRRRLGLNPKNTSCIVQA